MIKIVFPAIDLVATAVIFASAPAYEDEMTALEADAARQRNRRGEGSGRSAGGK